MRTLATETLQICFAILCNWLHTVAIVFYIGTPLLYFLNVAREWKFTDEYGLYTMPELSAYIVASILFYLPFRIYKIPTSLQMIIRLWKWSFGTALAGLLPTMFMILLVISDLGCAVVETSATWVFVAMAFTSFFMPFIVIMLLCIQLPQYGRIIQSEVAVSRRVSVVVSLLVIALPLSGALLFRIFYFYVYQLFVMWR